MRRLAWTIVSVLVCQGIAQAQRQVDLEALRNVPPDDAVVLEPAGAWESVNWPGSPDSQVAGMDEAAGHPRMAVAEPGKLHTWKRALAIPFDPERYPIAVLTYRASGSLGGDGRVLWLDDTTGPAKGGINVFYSQDLVADGKIREIVADMREREPKGEIIALRFYPFCQGPGPAVFELLGLRFESEHDLPPLAQKAGPSFALRVVDAKGAGVEGATVTADAERLNGARSATTDAKGDATVQALDNPFDKHALCVTKEGMVPVELQERAGRGFPETVTLIRGVPIGGVVRNEAGEPVENASVHVEVRHSCFAPAGRRTFVVLTDAKGRWRTPLLPRGPRAMSISLQHADYVSGPVVPPPLDKLRAGTAALVARRGILLRGVVVGPNGRPVLGAQVARGRNRWAASYVKVKTDAKGAFTFPSSVPMRALLTITSAGLAPATAEVDIATGMEDVTIELAAPSTIRGQVVDSTGAPVVDMRVSVSSWRDQRVLSWSAITDAEGRFAWRSAPSDTVLFELSKNPYQNLRGYPLKASDDERVVVVSLPLRITGTITDAATGEPVKQCTVVPGLRWRPREKGVAGPLNWKRHRAKKGTNGRYDITLPNRHTAGGNGRYTHLLRVEARGYTPVLSREFEASEDPQTLDFQLKKGSGISGRALLPDGTPAKGATVLFFAEGPRSPIRNGMPSAGGRNPSAKTEADGRYWLPAGEGRWTLAVLHESGYAECDPKQHAKSPDLKLKPWGRVEGVYRVRTAPVSGQEMTISPIRTHGSTFPSAPHSLSATTDAQGRFVFERVPPGLGAVGLRGRCGPHSLITSHGKPFELAPGETVRVEIGGTGRPVTGQAVLPEGAVAQVSWAMASGYLRAIAAPRAARPGQSPLPEMAKLPPAERSKRFQEWLKTDRGKAFAEGQSRGSAPDREARAKVEKIYYALPLKADGTFRVGDIPAGTYALSIQIYSGSVERPTSSGRWVGDIKHEFTVPDMEGGRSDEPLDLGKLTVKLRGKGR